MSDELSVSVRCPRDGEWIFIRPGIEHHQIVPLMQVGNGPVHLVAENMVELLRKEHGMEPPCEQNGVRYFYATLFFVCGRTELEGPDEFFLWPVELDEMQPPSGQWGRYRADQCSQ